MESGTRLGPYEIAERLGAGGMGEVYRATDTRLKRQVAVKVLPESVAADADRLTRFQREAEVLASLNHPHVAQIHGLEEADGVKALVMELVEGPTLADRIARGALPLDEALPIARQIAEALEAAHDQGIIHRDLKPANVKVREDGAVKVLDFGLAKALDPVSAASPEASHSPTLTSPALSQAGVLIGTAAYMSPEQARGKPVDRRADVWAFGVVLYEMLTGRRAFAGEDMTDTLAAVVRSEPAWDALPEGLSPTLRAFLERCLHKDPRQRIPDVGTMRLALEGAFDAAAGASRARDAATARDRALPLAGALFVGVLLAGAVAWSLWPRAEPRAVNRFAISLPAEPALRGTGRDFMAFSRDGRHVVVNTTAGLLLRAMDDLELRTIPGTERSIAPFFSPDGEWVAHFDQTTGELKRVALSGGAPVSLGVVDAPLDGRWSPDGTILLASRERILRLPATGGTPEVLIEAEGERLSSPQLMPGGDAVLFSTTTSGWDEARVVVQSLSTGTRTVLIEGGRDPRYLPTGHLVYALGGGLLAVAFDADRLAARGGPVSVIQGVTSGGNSGSANYDVSADGTLLYVAGGDGGAYSLVWVDREGREEPLAAPPRAYTYPRLSPDGSRVALDVRDEQNDIWIWDLSGETMMRLTFDPGTDRVPLWTRDGRRVAFSSQRDGSVASLFWQSADGTGEPEPLEESAGSIAHWPTAFSPDGATLLFTIAEGGGGGGRAIGIVSTRGEGGAEPLIATRANEQNAELSPDGRWLAYQSDESGEDEIYVRPFPEVSAGRWLVSRGGGTRPTWSRDGRELFYLVPPGRVMAVPIRPGQAFAYGNPETVVDGPYLAPNTHRTYDVSLDGQRFLMIKNADTPDHPTSGPTLVVVQNWTEELRQRVPTTGR